MKYIKYKKNNNTIHEVEIDNIEELREIIKNYDGFDSKASIEKFENSFNQLDYVSDKVNIQYKKNYTNHGNRPELRRVFTQNINCYKKEEENQEELNIYYDLTTKYSESDDIGFNRFVIASKLIELYRKSGYKINFIPVLFLKAYSDKTENNEYICIKFNNLDIDLLKQKNMVGNTNTSRVLLPEIVDTLDIENKMALDHNGYLLNREEKDMILGKKENDIIIDMFTSNDEFNGEILHDADIFYNKFKR